MNQSDGVNPRSFDPAGYPHSAIHVACPNQPNVMYASYTNYPPEQSQQPYHPNQMQRPYKADQYPTLDKNDPAKKTNERSRQPEGFGFTNQSIKRGFIRKVFGILSVQLIITFGIVLLFCLHERTNMYVKRNFWVSIVGAVLAFATIIPLACCDTVRRSFPINLILLCMLTIAEGIMAGVLGAIYGSNTVMIAMGLTALMVVGLMLFACQTKWDFTKLSGGLFIALLIFSVVGIIGAFMRSYILELTLSGFGVILFSIYLIHDTQLIVGGEREQNLNPEEYIMGALMLYLDIIRIFLYILRIAGAITKN